MKYYKQNTKYCIIFYGFVFPSESCVRIRNVGFSNSLQLFPSVFPNEKVWAALCFKENVNQMPDGHHTSPTPAL